MAPWQDKGKGDQELVYLDGLSGSVMGCIDKDGPLRLKELKPRAIPCMRHIPYELVVMLT